MADDYRQFATVHIATEDGSLGETGMVTGHSVLKSESLPYRSIYCCGPDGMMRAVSHIAEKQGIPCLVSLENTMACGIGACLCCVVDTNQGHRCVCTDGPVFNSLELKGWSAETEVGCSLDK
jgi:dihydroorotate dehydrogenase electron transfer subunit